MRIKFNWFIGVTLSIILFIIFVVFIAFILPIIFPNVKSQLISNEYYKEEIKYQEIINEKKNTIKFPNRIKVLISKNGIITTFPLDKGNVVHGVLTLLRFSSNKLDIKKNFYFIKFFEKRLFISKNELKKGYYKLIIRFVSDRKYFFEKDLFWK
ncbi:FixH family protein [Blattabacterium cuenoti]|uniref:FixH family protein n=1 Tax=Blattabacterium cuenoti TaxID=1653831 RepID=UPI00163CD487|nr:FixH family protein [Blattabacterium cuenoti]